MDARAHEPLEAAMPALDQAALFFDMLPFARAAWMPDVLSIVLVFWCVHQPRKVGIGVAFFLGLVTDVHQAALLGQHALTYTALGYLAVMIHRRLLWFSVPSQAMQVLPLFMAAHALELTVRMMSGALFPGWMILIAPIAEALLWPLVSAWTLEGSRRFKAMKGMLKVWQAMSPSAPVPKSQ